MSTVKTVIGPDKVAILLQNNFDKNASEIEPLAGGEMSQAYSFVSHGKDLVIRLFMESTSFEKDKYAAEHFMSSMVPIPKTLTIGKTDTLFYSITEKAKGKMFEDWDSQTRKSLTPKFMETLHAIHKTPIADRGFGWWDTAGHAKYDSWQESLFAKREHVEEDFMKANKLSAPEKKDIELIYDNLIKLIPHMPILHFLVHADYGGSNVMSDGEKITAVFDWGNSVYGDFLYDVAWLDFWWPEENLKELFKTFYQKRKIDIQDFERRILCYQLHMGMGILGFWIMSDQKEKYKMSKERIFKLLGEQDQNKTRI